MRGGWSENRFLPAYRKTHCVFDLVLILTPPSHPLTFPLLRKDLRWAIGFIAHVSPTCLTTHLRSPRNPRNTDSRGLAVEAPRPPAPRGLCRLSWLFRSCRSCGLQQSCDLNRLPDIKADVRQQIDGCRLRPLDSRHQPAADEPNAVLWFAAAVAVICHVATCGVRHDGPRPVGGFAAFGLPVGQRWIRWTAFTGFHSVPRLDAFRHY
jgi:hypothetical protein